jgi:DNA-binding GntR family transcriptional regulator
MPPRRRGPVVPYRRVAEALRERLDRAEWLAGEPLPSLRLLAEEYHVSQATVNRAVKLLAEEGRVTTIRGWGVFVSERGSP